MEVREGGLAFEIPDDESVFYNPDMELNRDITVGLLRVARGDLVPEADPTYLDAMTAAGVRGARAAAAGYRVTICDVNPDALDRARDNMAANGLEAEAVGGDVRSHAYGAGYDVVDLDPFGSPIPFVDAALDGARDLLCVTATDTAPLCGAHHAAGVRRYGANPRPTEYHAEVGLRILLGSLARRAAARDVAVDPVLSHATRHYVRTYLALESGARAADHALDHLGFLVHCPACLRREPVEGLAPPLPATCDHCGEPVDRIGPLWLGPYREASIVDRTATGLDDSMGTADMARRLLERLRDELDVVGHYDHHELCDRFDVSAAPIAEVIEALDSAGYPASRTHFGGTTFKTEAPMSVIESAVVDRAGSP